MRLFEKIKSVQIRHAQIRNQQIKLLAVNQLHGLDA